MSSIEQRISDTLANPATSYWLRQALTGALERDVCDAANDAEALADLLAARASAALQQSRIQS